MNSRRWICLTGITSCHVLRLGAMVYNHPKWTACFPWERELHTQNRMLFGKKSFRPMQREAINAIMDNQSHVFVIMATGGGKSLIFQLAASLGDGVSVVIMPLVSLIHDQIAQMKLLGVQAEFAVLLSANKELQQ